MIRPYLISAMMALSAHVSASATSTSASLREELPDTVTDLPIVTVTAIKQIAPAYADESLTVLGSEALSRLDLTDVKQLSAVAPNFYMPRYGSAMTSTIYVRGLGTRIDQPAVGLNIDNVPIVSKDNYDFQLADIESIEVIRGPQNILYGRNTMGGLINITTISPLRYEGVRASATYGLRNTWRANAGIYRRFGSIGGASLTLFGSGTDGYHRNLYDGSHAGAARTFGGRLKTIWQTRRGHTLQNSVTLSHTRQNGYPYMALETGRIDYNDTCSYRRLSFIDGLTVKGVVGNVRLSAIGSFQYINDNLTLDQDFLPEDWFTLTQKRHEWSVTADIVASSVHPAGGVYSWLAGCFGFLRRVNMSAPVTFYDTGLTNLIENNANAVSPGFPLYWDERRLRLNSDFIMPSRGVSLYHESVVRLGAFTITAGLRLDCENPTISWHSATTSTYTIYDATSGTPQVYRPSVPLVIDDSGHLTRTYTQLLPKLSVSFRLPQSAGNVYASVTKGYKSGGYNTQMFSDVLQQRLMGALGLAEKYNVDDIITYAPERIWNFEGGTHLSLLEGRLRGSLSLFWIECRDQQLTLFPEGSLTGRIMANAGRSRSRGVECSADADVGAGVTVQASYGLTDARFVDFTDGRTDFSGNFVPYSPRHTLWCGATWDHDFSDFFIDRLSVQAGVRGVGEIWWDEANTVRQPFYALVEASAAVSHGPFTLTVRASNLTSTHYSTFRFVSIGHTFLQRGDGFGLLFTLGWNLPLTS